MLNFREPTTSRYIYLTPNGDIDVQMPIVGALPDKTNKASISTDNTCKTLKVLQEFFGVAALSTNPSLERELNNYKQRLEYDLTLLITLDSKLTPNLKAIQQKKQKRLTQILAWQKFLREVISKPEIATHINTSAGYSPSIRAILKDHLHSIVLRPAQIDSYRSGLTPLFDMSKAATFYQMLVSELGLIDSKTLQPQKDNKKELLIKEALKSLKELKLPISSEGFERIQKVLSEQLPTIYKFTNAKFFSTFVDPQSKKKEEVTLAYFKNLGIIDDTSTVEDCATCLIACCGSALTQQLDRFFYLDSSTPENLEKLNITIQFFLGQINIACVSLKKTTANFAALLEKNHGLAKGFINIIKKCLTEGELVEPALLAYINENYQAFSLNAQLTPEEQGAIIPLFQDLYSIIADSPHLDEFTVLNNHNRGACAYHQGSIVVSFKELAHRLNIKLDCSLLFSTPPNSSMILDNENEAIAKEQLDLDIDHMTLINDALTAKPPNLEFIAQLLVSKITLDNKTSFLFTQLSKENVAHIKSSPFWPKLRTLITSKLTGTEITAFENHFQCVDISYPLTPKMLHALHINLIKKFPPSQWVFPKDYYYRGGLKNLLQNNGIHAEKVPESSPYNSTVTIICTPDQKLAIEEIIKANDNHVFIDSAMARAIYIAANEIAGTSDWDLVNGQRLNNKTNQGGIPAKIKRALQLLHITFSDQDVCYFPNKGNTPGYVIKTSAQTQQEILQFAEARPQLLLSEKMIAAFEIYVKRLPPQILIASGLEQIAKNDVKKRVTCLLNLIGYKTQNIGLSDMNKQEVWVEVHEEVKRLYEWISENQGQVNLDDYFNSGVGGGFSYARRALVQSLELETNDKVIMPLPPRQISGNGGGLNGDSDEPRDVDGEIRDQQTLVQEEVPSVSSPPLVENLPSALPQEIGDKLNKLREKIAVLAEYGAKLKATTTSKKAQDKGQVIEKLVSDLNTHCRNFEKDYALQPNIEVWNAFKLNFNTTIDNNKKELRKYSSYLKPILAIISSIIAALTVLGTAILLSKFIKAKQEDPVLSINSTCFFGRNKTEHLVAEVKEAKLELDQMISPNLVKG